MNKIVKNPQVFDYITIKCKNPNECLGNLLYIHGFKDTYLSHDVGEELSKNFNYYALNLPGHSQKVAVEIEQMNLRNYKYYICEFIKSQKLDNLFLIGHSMSGILVPWVGLKFINQISGIILVAPSNLGCITNLKYLKKSLKLDLIKDKELMLEAIYKDKEHYKNNPIYSITEDNIKQSWNYINRKQFKYLSKDIAKVTYSLFINPWNLWMIKRKQIPLMIFLGVYDKMIPLKSSMKFFESFRNKKMIIATFENSGHTIFQEQKDAYIKEIIHFAQKTKNNWI